MVTPVRPLDPGFADRASARTSICLVDGRTLTGCSRGTVGETLRFAPADDTGGLELVAFDRIETASLLALVEHVLATGLLDGELALVEHVAGRGHLAPVMALLQRAESEFPGYGAAIRACRRRIIRSHPGSVRTF